MLEALRRGVACFAFLAGAVFAQSVASRPDFTEFEVASIKPAPLSATGRWIRMLSANEFAARNHTVRTLIAAAYDLNPQAVIGGPSWAESDRYDILAKTSGSARPNLNEQMSMLRR